MARWPFQVVLGLAVVALGAFHSVALVTDGDSEGAYLHHGWLMVRGDLGLYANEMTGHRTPLPYWWIGLSQLLFGPSLLVGRLVSLLVGWAAMVLLWLAARRALGELAGTLVVVLLATNHYLLGHFAVAAFHGLAFLWVALGAWCLIASRSPWRGPALVLCAWGLFLTRPQFGLCVPLAALWASIGMRAAPLPLLAALGLPGTLFLAAYWPGVLKMAAYVPGLEAWATGQGWVSVPMPQEPDWGTRVSRAGLLALRSYKGWIVAGLTGWALWPVGGGALPSAARIILATVCFLAVSQLVVVNYSWKSAIGYFPVFAGLLAVPLAARYAQILSAGQSVRRLVALGIFAAALGFGPVASPPPHLPLAVDPARFSALEAVQAGRDLASIIPSGSRVFLFGSAVVPHLAGLRPPVQPSNHLETLVPNCLRRRSWTLPELKASTVSRSGLWCLDQINEWLGADGLPWAVIWWEGLAHRAPRYGWTAEAARIDQLLVTHYDHVGDVAYHGIRLEVWRKMID